MVPVTRRAGGHQSGTNSATASKPGGFRGPRRDRTRRAFRPVSRCARSRATRPPDRVQRRLSEPSVAQAEHSVAEVANLLRKAPPRGPLAKRCLVSGPRMLPLAHRASVQPAKECLRVAGQPLRRGRVAAHDGLQVLRLGGGVAGVPLLESRPGHSTGAAPRSSDRSLRGRNVSGATERVALRGSCSCRYRAARSTPRWCCPRYSRWCR